MSAAHPGRNDPCPCGSGRKYKQCCLEARAREESARLRLRRVSGLVVDKLLDFIDENFGRLFLDRAWEDFWNSDEPPEDLSVVPEWEAMFVPWLVMGFVRDPHDDEADPEWPAQPVGLEWLATTTAPVPDLERAFIETASRSPFSVFAVEGVEEGRSVDFKDVLTGRRFHVIFPGGSRELKAGDLVFTRVVTLEGISLLFGTAPYIVPPEWHTRIIDWRERLFGTRLMTLDDLANFDIEIRDLCFDTVAGTLDPEPPRLANTDGDPLELTTLTYELNVSVEEAMQKLMPLARVDGEEHPDEVLRNESGEVTQASLSWMRPGERAGESWDRTLLGSLRIESHRLTAEVNSARRAETLKHEIAKRLGRNATLQDTSVTDMAAALADAARRRVSGEQPEEFPEPEQSSGEVQAFLDEMLRRHFVEWVDTPVPALGNKTPRDAALTPGGRERLQALLVEFERRAHDGVATMPARVAELRRTLGLPPRE